MINFFPDRFTMLEINIGSFVLTIRWYAFLILMGALLAYYFARREAKKAKNIDLDVFDTFFILVLWVGIIGARLWYCLFYNFSYYLSNPMAIIRLWDGGLAIQGGVVAALIFGYFYWKHYNYPFLKIADICLPTVLLAQGIGRWGNFVNQECHGKEVTESYFDGILGFLKNGMFIDGHYYQPLFFYESVLCIIGFVVIYFVLKKCQNKRGDLAYAYMMWYGVVRFFIEGNRTDSLYLGNIKMAQLTSVVFLLLGLFGYFGGFDKLIKKKKPTIVFDMDGTLIDTKESILEGYRAVFAKFDKIDNFTPEREKEVIGPALKELFPIYFPNIEYDELYKVYKQRQQEVCKTTNHLMPHCKETIEYLYTQGYQMCICSTRKHQGLVELLQDFGMSEYFIALCGVDDVKESKPSPSGLLEMFKQNGFNHDCVYVGDTKIDQKTAENFGAYFVGFGSKEQFSESANATIEDMQDLLTIIEKKTSFTYDEK